MTRSDWVSVAVTLILAGIGYFVSGPKMALSAIGIGLLIILFARVVTRKSSTPAEVRSPAERMVVENSGNATATGGSIVVNNYATPLPHNTQSLTVPVRELTSNIRCASASFRRIAVGDDGAFYESDESPFAALVICFRNDGDEGDVCEAHGVTANVRFFDADNQEMGNGISGVSWLNARTDMATIPPDETKCLLAVVFDPHHESWEAPYLREQQLRGRYPFFSDYSFRLPVPPAFIEIRLRDEWNKALLPKPLRLKIHRDGSGPAVTF